MTSDLEKAEETLDCPIWVINLERSKGRLEAITRDLGSHQLPFTRLNAISPDNPPEMYWPADQRPQYVEHLNKTDYFTSLKTGEINCFLSHQLAWQWLLASDAPYAMVLEDDVQIIPRMRENLGKALRWLDSTEPRMLKLYSKRPVGGTVAVRLTPEVAIKVPRLPPLGTQAQALNRAAATLLSQQAKVFGVPVDVFLQARWNTGVTIGVMQPPLFNEVSATTGGSTLSEQSKRNFGTSLMRELVRLRFRISRSLRARQ